MVRRWKKAKSGVGNGIPRLVLWMWWWWAGVWRGEARLLVGAVCLGRLLLIYGRRKESWVRYLHGGDKMARMGVPV